MLRLERVPVTSGACSGGHCAKTAKFAALDCCWLFVCLQASGDVGQRT